MDNHTTLSDSQLFDLCRQYGANALLWRRRFIGLLPEVHKRRLHEKKGFSSIFEFAAKLAGLSEPQVREALNLEKRFVEMPALHGALVRGEVSVNKLARVASIATPGNQGALAEQVKLLSKSALETLVRDEKSATSAKSQDAFPEPLFDQKSLPGQTSTPYLSYAVKERLMGLQNKGIDINILLTELLDQHEEEITREKEEVAERLTIEQGAEHDMAIIFGETPPKPSRYIPARVRKIIAREHGTKCAKPQCHRPAQQLHHTNRFSMSGNHDPHYLAPLCKEHHQIAHTIDVRFHERRAESQAAVG